MNYFLLRQNLPSKRFCLVSKDWVVEQSVNQAQFECTSRVKNFSWQNQSQSIGDANEFRETYTATKSGQNTKPDLR